MTTEYTEVFRDAAAVEKYETVVYAPDSYASAINRRQRAYLRRLVRRAFGTQPPVQHDFACGTGRAVRILQGMVREAHGYDTSAAMMERAADVGAVAHWHEVLPDGPVPLPSAAEPPAIVTMFRLLLNVGESVRDRALGFAALALPSASSGLLVLENHGNAQSLRHLGARRNAGRRWFAELSHASVQALLDRHGFELVARRGFSMVTQSWYERRWLRPFAKLIDGVVTRLPGADRFAVNVVYVARRAPR